MSETSAKKLTSIFIFLSKQITNIFIFLRKHIDVHVRRKTAGAGRRQSQGLLRVRFGSEALLPDSVCSSYTDCLGGRDGLPRATGAQGRRVTPSSVKGPGSVRGLVLCGCVGTTAALLGVSVGAPTAPRGLQGSPPPAHCPELARVPAPHRTRRSSPGGRCQRADCAGRGGPGAREGSGLGVLKPEPLQREGRNLCL